MYKPLTLDLKATVKEPPTSSHVPSTNDLKDPASNPQFPIQTEQSSQASSGYKATNERFIIVKGKIWVPNGIQPTIEAPNCIIVSTFEDAAYWQYNYRLGLLR